MTENPDTTIRLGRISFDNVLPVYYELERLAPRNIKLISDVPSALNGLMEQNLLDISPVSTAAYAKNSRDWMMLPDLSVSCSGPVMSVRMACRRPVEGLDGKVVLLTRDSGTASALVRWWLRRNQVNPVYRTAWIRFPADVPAEADAALVIGNAALSTAWEKEFPYLYDLGEEWKKMENLPFVFAVWAVRREFAGKNRAGTVTVLDMLYKSRAAGMERIKEIASRVASNTSISRKSAELYFSRLIYSLGKKELAGLSAFFSCLAEIGLVENKPEIHFFDHQNL